MNRKRLKRIVDVKRRLRDAQKTAVAAAGASLASADAMLSREQASQAAQQTRLGQVGSTTAPELAMAADLVAMAGVRVKVAQMARARMEAEYERVRQHLVESAHEVQRVEKLHERAQKAHAREVRLREQRDLDEVAARTGGVEP